MCVDLIFLFGFFDIEDTFGQNFVQHDGMRVCTPSTFQKTKITPITILRKKQPNNGFKNFVEANCGVATVCVWGGGSFESDAY